VDFTKDELRQIQMGIHPEWNRIGDNSAYGGVYKSKKYPGKVIKVQSGDHRTFDNEVGKQFQAFLSNDGDYEVPQLHQAEFFPNDPSISKRPDPKSGILKYDPHTTGISFIAMDEADFDEVQGAVSRRNHASARGFTSLYRGGVSHTDDHAGNVKWNSKTNKPVILDYGLAQIADGTTGSGKRVERIQNMLGLSGNVDLLDTWNEIHGDLYSDHITNPTPKSKAALDDWLKQGEDVGMMTDPRIAPVNWTEENRKMADLDKPLEVTSSGPKAWNRKSNAPPTPGGMTGVLENIIQQMQENRDKLQTNPPKLKNYGSLGTFLSLGAADLIPSRETVKSAYNKGPIEAAKQHGNEFVRSIPVASGLALLSNTVPAIAQAAPYVAPALITTAVAEATDEVVKQQTGEGVIPKFRQAIGTEKRTGYASPNNSLKEQIKQEQDRINNPPTIKPTTRKPTRAQIKDTPFPGIAHRLRLAGDRFNPSKLEFGISEILFGR